MVMVEESSSAPYDDVEALGLGGFALLGESWDGFLGSAKSRRREDEGQEIRWK